VYKSFSRLPPGDQKFPSSADAAAAGGKSSLATAIQVVLSIGAVIGVGALTTAFVILSKF